MSLIPPTLPVSSKPKNISLSRGACRGGVRFPKSLETLDARAPRSARLDSGELALSLPKGGSPRIPTSSGPRLGGDQAAVKLEVVVDHAFGGEAFAGASVGAVGVGAAQG